MHVLRVGQLFNFRNDGKITWAINNSSSIKKSRWTPAVIVLPNLKENIIKKYKAQPKKQSDHSPWKEVHYGWFLRKMLNWPKKWQKSLIEQIGNTFLIVRQGIIEPLYVKIYDQYSKVAGASHAFFKKE